MGADDREEPDMGIARFTDITELAQFCAELTRQGLASKASR
jgi:hypothetical protein